MADKNPITGDPLISKSSIQYSEKFDSVFDCVYAIKYKTTDGVVDSTEIVASSTPQARKRFLSWCGFAFEILDVERQRRVVE